MNPLCVQAVQAAIGRGLGMAEAKRIDDGIALQMRLLARKDPQAWRALSQPQRLQQAASAAADGLVAEVKKQQQRVLLNIAAVDKIENFLALKGAVKPGDMLRAVSQLLDFDTKGGGFTSAGSWTNALQKEAFGNLIDTWSASHPKFFGLFENTKDTKDLIHELWGEHTGNAAAKAGADAWRKTMDELRDRFNAAGGDVGKLDEWHYPQSHSQSRIGKAGFDQWFADTLPLLDRQKYLKGDGTPFSDTEMRDFMSSVYDSIITDGNNKRDTSRPQGYGLQTNRGSEHRQVFFKNADSYLSYQGNYGDRSLWNVLTSHVRSITRDIGVAETLGPNSERVFGAFNQRALTQELRAHPAEKSSLRREAAFNDRLFDYVSGRQEVVDPKLAERFQAFRNFMTAAKLPKVVITALGDEAGMAATAFANHIPYGQAFMREMLTLEPTKNHGDRRILEGNGLGLDSMSSGLNRLGQEDYSTGWTGKLASFVMHASGAERMWDSRRQGLGSVLMHYIAGAVKDHANFADINRADHGVLANKGITEADWKVWQAATPEEWRGMPMITPKSIHAIPDSALAHFGDPQALRRHAATNLLAHVLEEAGMGAMDTGARQRVTMQGGTTRGTMGGELVKSALLFKSFAASMMLKHWARAAEMPGMGSKFGYMAPLIVYGTAIAALGNQLRNVLLGKDPENMASPRFWGSAVLRGGGLGFFGDFLYDEFTQNDNSLAAALGGPMLTTAEDVWKLTGAAVSNVSQGKRVDEGAKAIRFAKQNIPLLNLWYTQAAMDHILWNSMQDAASPGYLDRMQIKAEATRGTSWYWKPDETTPERAPDVSLAHLWDTERGAEEGERLARNVGIE